jgi:dimethylhistidine N-methyltransferase
MQPSAASTTRTASDLRQFADDVAYYLTLEPRQLPSRYFYDNLGSALFEAISRLPWYRITRAEQGLLTAYGPEILDRVQPLSTLLELGPGSGEKLAAVLQAANPDVPLNVHLVDVSAAALDAASRVVSLGGNVSVITHEASYESGLEEAARERQGGGRMLTLFLGSNIGNFDPPGADAFLRAIRAALTPGDGLLLGADLVKPERELLLAYDDPLGVTAAFNRNLLVRVNRELGGDFDVSGFAHCAVWNQAKSRIEMLLVSMRRQRVRIPQARLDFVFEEGETIWTESSYKYRPQGIIDMLRRAGFGDEVQWSDQADGFALTLATARVN